MLDYRAYIPQHSTLQAQCVCHLQDDINFALILHFLSWSKVKYVRHYIDVLMGALASQITSLTIVYSTVYSDADQRKYQSNNFIAY